MDVSVTNVTFYIGVVMKRDINVSGELKISKRYYPNYCSIVCDAQSITCGVTKFLNTKTYHLYMKNTPACYGLCVLDVRSGIVMPYG